MLRDKAMRDIFGEADTPDTHKPSPSMPLAEREALAVLELTPPVDFAAIKVQYRVLVKKHHPDMHDGDHENEEKFKDISQAFATLRKIYAEQE
jgi:DnaJ-domain-containing protein 1